MEIKDIISSGVLEAYAAGLASEEERRQVEDWAARYPEVRAELAEIEAALEAYAFSNAAAPAAGLKDKVMAAISTSAASGAPALPVTQQRAGMGAAVVTMWKRVAAACAVLLIGSVAAGIALYNKNKAYGRELAETKKEISRRDAAVSFQQAEYLQHHHTLELLMSGAVAAVELKKTANAPGDCGAKVFWNKATGEVYIDPCQLINTPAGKQYQLWAMVDGKPQDAGLIKTGDVRDKYSIQKMKKFMKAEAFAVTLEQEGGSAVPTMSNLYVMGKAV